MLRLRVALRQRKQTALATISTVTEIGAAREFGATGGSAHTLISRGIATFPWSSLRLTQQDGCVCISISCWGRRLGTGREQVRAALLMLQF